MPKLAHLNGLAAALAGLLDERGYMRLCIAADRPLTCAPDRPLLRSLLVASAATAHGGGGGAGGAHARVGGGGGGGGEQGDERGHDGRDRDVGGAAAAKTPKRVTFNYADADWSTTPGKRIATANGGGGGGGGGGGPIIGDGGGGGGGGRDMSRDPSFSAWASSQRSIEDALAAVSGQGEGEGEGQGGEAARAMVGRCRLTLSTPCWKRLELSA